MSYNRRTLASDSPWAVVAAMLMIIAAVMMLVAVPEGLKGNAREDLRALLPLLPSAACICTAVMLVSRKNSLIPTALPVAAVCLYAAASFREAGTSVLVVCSISSAVLGALYLLAVAGALSSRIPLIAVSIAAAALTLIGVPTASNGDVCAAVAASSPALCAAALFCVACGMRRGRSY